MCHQERASIVAVVTSLLVNGYVIAGHLELSRAGALSGPDATMLWARMMLWAIPAAIGLTILLNVLFALATKDRVLGSTVDERDRLFELRGRSTTLIVFGLGFVAAMGGLALGWMPLTGIIAFWASAALADLVGNLVRVASYRISS